MTGKRRRRERRHAREGEISHPMGAVTRGEAIAPEAQPRQITGQGDNQLFFEKSKDPDPLLGILKKGLGPLDLKQSEELMPFPVIVDPERERLLDRILPGGPPPLGEALKKEARVVEVKGQLRAIDEAIVRHGLTRKLLDREQRARDRLDPTKGYQFASILKPRGSIKDQRSALRRSFSMTKCIAAALEITGKQATVTMGNIERLEKSMLDATWFDFRAISDPDPELSRFGRELVADGIAHLPFASCVFVFGGFVYMKDGRRSDADLLLFAKEEDDRPCLRPGVHALYEGLSVHHRVYAGGQSPIPIEVQFEGTLDGIRLDRGPETLDEYCRDMLCGALAMMISKHVERTRCNLFGNKANPLPANRAPPKFDYYICDLMPELRARLSLGGTHAPPKLHWRRGHVRTYHRGTDREFKGPVIRALIGKAERGVVLKDYAAGGKPQ